MNTKYTHALLFTERELATILAALRYWQRRQTGAAHNDNFEFIATDGGAFEKLTAEEIDALCERINE